MRLRLGQCLLRLGCGCVQRGLHGRLHRLPWRRRLIPGGTVVSRLLRLRLRLRFDLWRLLLRDSNRLRLRRLRRKSYASVVWLLRRKSVGLLRLLLWLRRHGLLLRRFRCHAACTNLLLAGSWCLLRHWRPW